MEVQAKLLRVLESGEVKAVGDSRNKKVNVRVIAATNRDLTAMVQAGQFRKDLFYRLSVLPLSIPPLRERLEDIPLLADAFLRSQSKTSKDMKRLSPEAIKVLLAQNWPGNVRELKNALERAFLLAEGTEIHSEDLLVPFEAEILGAVGSFREAKRVHVQAFEKQYLSYLLRQTGGNISKAAREAGLARRNFQSLLKKHHLRSSAFKKN